MAYEQLRLDHQLCFRLYTASRLIVQGYQPFLPQIGLTYTQYIVMMVLWEKDSQTVGEIGAKTKLDTNTLTPLIKRLEAEGFVKRSKGKQDGRQTIVSLTPKGRELEAEAAKVPGCLADELHTCDIQDADMMQLAGLLDKLIEKLSN